MRILTRQIEAGLSDYEHDQRANQGATPRAPSRVKGRASDSDGSKDGAEDDAEDDPVLLVERGGALPRVGSSRIGVSWRSAPQLGFAHSPRPLLCVMDSISN